MVSRYEVRLLRGARLYGIWNVVAPNAGPSTGGIVVLIGVIVRGPSVAVRLIVVVVCLASQFATSVLSHNRCSSVDDNAVNWMVMATCWWPENPLMGGDQPPSTVCAGCTR